MFSSQKETFFTKKDVVWERILARLVRLICHLSSPTPPPLPELKFLYRTVETHHTSFESDRVSVILLKLNQGKSLLNTSLCGVAGQDTVRLVVS